MIAGYVQVIGLAIFFAIMMAVGQGFYMAYLARKENEAEELRRRLGTMTHEEAEAVLFRERARDAAAGALGSLGVHLQNVLIEAESDWTVGSLLVRMAAGSIVGVVVGAIVAFPYGMFPGLLIGILPYLLMRQRGSARNRMLIEQLPESLDLMARSLQAGLGLSDAFRMCAEEMPMPIAGEFGRVFEEVRFGRDYRAALNGLLDRNPRLFELRIFVSSVLLQRETGGNLIEILNTISGTVRNRFLFDAKLRALTAEAKFSAMILGGLPIFVTLIISVMNPDYFTPLFEERVGNGLIFIFCSMYGLGGFLMYTISNVEA